MLPIYFRQLLTSYKVSLTGPQFSEWSPKAGTKALPEAFRRKYASVNYAIIGSDNVLSPVRRQAIILTSDGLLLTEIIKIHFSDIRIKIEENKFENVVFWWLFRFVFNVLIMRCNTYFISKDQLLY